MASNATFKKFHQKIRQLMTLVGFEPGTSCMEVQCSNHYTKSLYINEREKIIVFKLGGV